MRILNTWQRGIAGASLLVAVGGASYLSDASDEADFSAYPAGPERKQAFLDYFLPLVEQANRAVSQRRERLLRLAGKRDSLGWWERYWVKDLAREYGIEDFEFDNAAHWQRLQRRVDVVPASLSLAQAAKESGWGTSRFARTGNNFFGLWCYETGCGLVPKRRRHGHGHEVAVFDSPRQSVEKYLHNLNTNDAYRQFRRIRAGLRESGETIRGQSLVDGLRRYSQRGDAYVEELKTMISFNRLERFDAGTK
jgi:Bax protein